MSKDNAQTYTQRTFNAWVHVLGYKWTGPEALIKGFMTEGEARVLISDYVANGRLAK